MSSLTNFAPLTEVQAAILEGLTRSPKSLPPWLFYDAHGSQLFEQITRTPEYYPTRTERSIFEAHADDIMAAAGTPRTVIELGAGSAEKTPTLLAAALRRRKYVTYVPMDVCAEALDSACDHLARRFPTLQRKPIVGSYVAGLPQQRFAPGRKLVLYIGSSIGNFDPSEASAILSRIGTGLTAGDNLLLGVDLVKPESTLLAAYNDAQGVTAAFNLNMLTRLNREADADFDLSNFRHVALWNPSQSRIEMHLESLADQKVQIGNRLQICLNKGERIHSENSYKFTDAKVRHLLDNSGFKVHSLWQDSQKWFGVYLAERHP